MSNYGKRLMPPFCRQYITVLIHEPSNDYVHHSALLQWHLYIVGAIGAPTEPCILSGFSRETERMGDICVRVWRERGL